jgi:crotonobetainyl-CoA:carnitine CoA-transferase CaiB-like acyl-CoA transferase
VADYEHPVYGHMREVGHVIHFSDAAGEIQGPPPTIGQHTREILRELDYSSDQIERLLQDRVVRASLETGAVV